ncbi:MAG: 50S ribosomal protein L33 [Chloroflexi bacterium]|nr:50S ribosomal protein L33 [Chloroflexota bacterium]
MASKNAIRTIITLECGECKTYTYHSEKNKRNTPDRISLSKFCPRCRAVHDFREKR